MTAAGLRWEKQPDRSSWYAYSGDMLIGMVVERAGVQATARRWVYSVSGVNVRYVAKGHGTVRSRHAAKRAVSRAWGVWLLEAGLQPRPPLPTP